MVDLQKSFSPGILPGRNIFLFASGLLVAIFAFLFITAPTVHAADATWQGSAISYAQKQFIKAGNATDNDVRKLQGGNSIPKDSPIYAYVEPTISNSSNPTQKAHIIYFAPGTDPTQAKEATYLTYDYTPPSTYSNPSVTTLITLDPATNGVNAAETTSCALEGIGWIICPVTKFLAGAMDTMFKILSGFLTVRPVQTSQDNPLFRIWAIMRNFANIAFVIGFLVIIYSQVTSLGISKYGIKKLLPRLIAAAILVNISYWICAVAVDTSNIFGNSIQALFINMRETLVGPGGNNWDTISWESMSGFVLSGGTAAVVAGIGVNALLGGSVTASSVFLVPILVIVLTSVLVALLIVALRQALITILIIVSPLAFVAYLLPNTEKYFEKWRDLFMTMLLMFPILSVIFGGSQLAGAAIIQNADSINLILLGMAVQVAPLIVTPLLIKFSGALLSRFAGVLNNPNKGFIDRTRNWAKDRAENQKAEVLGRKARPGWRGAATRRTQNIDAKRRAREGNKAAYQSMADARWANSQEFSNIQQMSMKAALSKDVGESTAAARFEAAKNTNGDLQQLEMEARAAKLHVDVSKARTEANWREITAGDGRSIVGMSTAELASRGIANYAQHRTNMVEAIKNSTLEQGVENRRAHSAEHVQQHNATQALLRSDALRQRAGGIDPHGADSALAAAITADRKAYGDSVAEATQFLKHFNLSGSQRQQLAMGGEPITLKDGSGFERTFTANDLFAREAAIETQMKGAGNYKQIEQIIMNSGGTLKNFKTTISSEIVANKLSEKAAFLGGRTIDRVAQGEIVTEADLNVSVAETIAKGKIRPQDLATMDADAVKRVLDVAKVGNTAGLTPEEAAALATRIRELGISANTALTNPSLKGRVADNVREVLEEFRREWPPPTP
jgi:hypothetical protein